MTRQRYAFLVLILGTLTALSPFSIDMYLPAFPQIAGHFHTTVQEVSRSLSSFFIGLAFGQLLYGPLMDRYGRKNPLYFGLGLYILTSIGCFLSGSIEMLIALRFIQALGSCAAGVAAMAMVRDLFPVKDTAKVFALLILVLGASPMLAPTIGGYLSSAWGWQSVFLALLIIAALILTAVIFTLPESYKPDPGFSLKPRPIINSFLSVIKEPAFYTYAISGAIGFSGLFAYVAGSPVVFMELFHLSGKVYGLIFAFLSIGFIGFSQFNNILLNYFRSEQLAIWGLSLQTVAGSVFLAGSFNGWFGLGGTIAMIFIFLIGVGLSNPNTTALSLAPFSKNAGTASSLMGAMQLGIGSLTSFAISVFGNHSALPLAVLLAATPALGLGILLIGRTQIKTEETVLKTGTTVGPDH
jgi:DHA1 family bicyclomycin/chloramphenicol resistance-like MFS transporter